MKQIETVKARVTDVIAVNSVLDQFDNFNQNLKGLATKYNMKDIMHHLTAATKGESTFFKKRGIYRFYQENKDMVDTINTNSDIFMFLSQNYNTNGTINPDLNYYYRYLLNHKDKKEQIQGLLQKLKELDIKEVEMNEKTDFTKEEHSLEFWECHSFFNPIIYLENIEILPNYEKDTIKYRSTESNYKLMIGNKRFSYLSTKIIVNNLIFPIENLPKSVNWKSVWNDFLELAKSQQESKRALKNAVDLDISLQDLDTQISDTCSTFTRITDVNSKPELVAALTQIKCGIAELYGIKRDFDAEITAEHPSLSQQIIKEETKQYLKLRENMIDID